MRSTFIFLFFFAISINIYGQGFSARDSMQIVLIINDWNKAWDIKDHLLASKWYSEDAKFTNAFGDKKNGRKEIEALLKEVFSLPFVMAGKSETAYQTFQPLSADLVIIHTGVVRKGQKMPDESTIPERKTTHLRVIQKSEVGGWQIKAHLISDARDKQSSKH